MSDENTATLRVALMDRHGTEQKAVSVEAGWVYELHGPDGLVERFTTVAVPRFAEGDCHRDVFTLVYEEGGLWSVPELIEVLSGDHKEKTIGDAAWDLVNEYGVVDKVDEYPLTIRTNDHSDRAYREAIRGGE